MQPICHADLHRIRSPHPNLREVDFDQPNATFPLRPEIEGQRSASDPAAG